MDVELKQQLSSGETVNGIMLSELCTPNLARLLANCGFDFLLVDCEHGYFNMVDVANLIAVAEGNSFPVLVRVAQNSQSSIAKYLDMGAHGILMANIENEKQTSELVKMCLYAPDGDRGVSTFRAHTGYKRSDINSMLCKANQRNIVMCQVESPEAVEIIDKIISVPGLDGVLVGPNDLSQRMGVIGQYNHPHMLKAVEKIAQSAQKYGKWSGVISGDEELLRFCRGAGMTFFSAGSELSILSAGAIDQLRRTKAILNGSV